ncbi:MAG TPA: MarR family transcriptional regulator [Lachnospiraceae bacterium]|nr:MarR family transcriptional regulator [Lachnospiraceae bacterium]HIS61716.1 MarR family transcriptional regulator [Candidatus Scybalomonas excrementigallinarum]
MERATVREVLLQLESNRKRLLKPYFQEIGLTLGQGQPRILNTLLKKDHISQRELADQCEMDVTNMSRTLDRMVEAGFLTRERKPGCRRSYLIVLTEFGRKKAEEVHRGFKKVDEILWRGFSNEDMEFIVKGLQKMSANLENMELTVNKKLDHKLGE